ncbi:MAG: hypothetical protein IPL71_22630 [Anaerolineales bacterium]|uniref:hypothetical protein n=1 Tax=Candidatus Villigracilis proximus TaxID=3140683 RepID=UPI0031359297|nr:hypothetical protein [Anaerolineales bacterium]
MRFLRTAHTHRLYVQGLCPLASKSFDTSEWYDYIFGFLTAGFLSAIAAFLVTLIGGIGFIGWLLILSAAPIAGTTIAEAVRVVTRRHRSRSLFITVAVGMVLGALPVLIVQLLSMNIFGIVFQGIYLFIAVPLVYTRLSGIQLFK